MTVCRADRLRASPRVWPVAGGLRGAPEVRRLFDTRAAMGRGERLVDWAMAEQLAFGSLVLEGTSVCPVARTAGAARSANGHLTPRGTVNSRHDYQPQARSIASIRARRGSRSTTALCPKRRCSDSSGLSRWTLRGARPVGGTVRGLRQRAAGRHRSVRGRVPRTSEAPVRNRAASAARFEGQGPTTRAHAGALSAARSRGQVVRRPAVQAPVLSSAAAAGPMEVAQATLS